MEIFESVTNILSMLFGGSLISIVTWKFARRKADAEAKKAEAEAKAAEAEAQQEKQNYYQQIIDDIAKDRDYYKGERDEMRNTIKKYDERMDQLERSVARNGRMVEAMRPFMCADIHCKKRQRVVLSAEGEVEEGNIKTPERPITPYGKEVEDESE
jgi:flagellar motility protein MotE (MotC chaperone)